MFHLVISAEILRICRVKTKLKNFVKSSKILVARSMKEESLINHMKKALLNLSDSQNECFFKFGKTNDFILNKLVNFNLYITESFVYERAGRIMFYKIF